MSPLSSSQSLLFQAWVSEPEEAGAHWQQWRKSVDLASLDSVSCFLLPLLRPRLDGWLAGDAARPLLLGICKQAWSGNQLRLRNLRILWQAIVARGIEPVVVGTAASALLAEGPAILPIVSFEIMVPLDGVAPALEEATRLGWSPTEPILKPMSYIRMANGSGDEWNLRWRRFSSAPDLACEASAVPVARPALTTWMGTTFTIPAPEWHLLEILADEPYTERPYWFCEALLALRQSINWEVFQHHLDGPVVAKLRYLASLGQTQIPHRFLARPAASWRLYRRIRSVYRDYRLWRKQRRNSSRLVQYLRIRWDARSAAQLPLLAIRAAVLHFRFSSTNAR
jgi:hypothetical protein